MTGPLPTIAMFMPAIDRGGIASALGRISEALAATGLVQVDILTGTPEAPAAGDLAKHSRVVGLGGGGLVPKLGLFKVEKTRQTFSTVRALMRYLRSEQPEFLVTFQGAATAVLAARLSRYRGEVIVRESSTPSIASRFPNSFLKPLKRVVKGWSSRRADRVIAISRGAREDIADFLHVPLDHIEVIYNPIPPSSALAADGSEPPHPWLSEDSETPVVVTVARLVEQKGVSTVIRAVARANESRPIRLIVVGDGPHRKWLEGLASELNMAANIEFTGWVSNSPSYIRHADVFAFGTRFEGLGNVLLEALSLGTPIVCSDAPNGPRDILDDGNCGLLVPVDDHVAMAGSILRYLDEPELLEAHRAHGREHLKNFSPEHIANQYLEVLGIPVS